MMKLIRRLFPPAPKCPNCGEPEWQCLNRRAICLPRNCDLPAAQHHRGNR